MNRFIGVFSSSVSVTDQLPSHSVDGAKKHSQRFLYLFLVLFAVNFLNKFRVFGKFSSEILIFGVVTCWFSYVVVGCCRKKRQSVFSCNFVLICLWKFPGGKSCLFFCHSRLQQSICVIKTILRFSTTRQRNKMPV